MSSSPPRNLQENTSPEVGKCLLNIQGGLLPVISRVLTPFIWPFTGDPITPCITIVGGLPCLEISPQILGGSQVRVDDCPVKTCCNTTRKVNTFWVKWYHPKNIPSLKLTAKSPENGWLEYNRFLLGPGLFSGANC